MATDKDTNVPNKTDYISREAMHRANKLEWDGIILKGYNDGHQVFIDNEEMIDSIPAADVRTVVRGENIGEGYITKESALSCFHDWIDRYGHEHTADEMVEYQRIEELLEADVVDVVRCKDCIYYNTTGCADGFGWCEEPTISNGVDDYFYCAGGVRKEEEIE